MPFTCDCAVRTLGGVQIPFESSPSGLDEACGLALESSWHLPVRPLTWLPRPFLVQPGPASQHCPEGLPARERREGQRGSGQETPALKVCSAPRLPPRGQQTVPDREVSAAPTSYTGLHPEPWMLQTAVTLTLIPYSTQRTCPRTQFKSG